MKHIKKKPSPNFFLTDTRTLSSWPEYYGHKKRKLKKYILTKEQYYLCAYCEKKVIMKRSHIEHIKPKSIDFFPELTFSYENLIVSCNGTCNITADNPSTYTCGHVKDNEYENELFLDPTILNNINDYFIYEYDKKNNVKISPSTKDPTKSIYMIETLGLNEGELPKARKIALKAFRQNISKFSTIKDKRLKIAMILSSNNIAFISAIKYIYRNIT